MRLAIVACLLRSAFTKQEDLLLLREDQCADALFVAHWTHVPKAGGTALAGLARRIACAKNPQIKDLNPCCVQDFCADHRTYAQACRATFDFNRYDHEIYEHAHRLFCARLEKAGLRGDEAVETELASSNLCGALDFSKVDDVCGRLETPEILMKKAAHDARCAHRGPGAQPRVADESIGGLFSRLRGA